MGLLRKIDDKIVNSKFVKIIVIFFLIILGLGYCGAIFSSSDDSWSCSSVISYDYNWSNDYRCVNNSTGEIRYTSKEMADRLD